MIAQISSHKAPGKCKGDFNWANDGDRLVLDAFFSLYFDVLEPYVTGA